MAKIVQKAPSNPFQKRVHFPHSFLKQKVGESFKTNDTLAEIETEKVVVTVPATESGIITKIFVNQGDIVKVGADIFQYEPRSEVVTNKAKTQSSKTEFKQ